MTRLTDYDIENQFTAKVKKTVRLTPLEKEEIRELVLEVPDFDCTVNQSFGVLVKTKGEYGKHLHHRLYSVADIPEIKHGKTTLKMLVKRCSYVDDFNGEAYPGIASNYLCDRAEGDEITVTGPFPIPFEVPVDKSTNLILIGMGTGIAPFRAFVKNIYANVKNWEGKIRLFYGANSGLELLYLNEKDGDLTNYYDQDTFKAFHALSPRPAWSDPIALDHAIVKQSDEIKDMLALANTRVYIAGYEKIKPHLEKAFSEILGSEEAWKIRKAELIAGNKWAEVIY